MYIVGLRPLKRFAFCARDSPYPPGVTKGRVYTLLSILETCRKNYTAPFPSGNKCMKLLLLFTSCQREIRVQTSHTLLRMTISSHPVPRRQWGWNDVRTSWSQCAIDLHINTPMKAHGNILYVGLVPVTSLSTGPSSETLPNKAFLGPM